MTETKPWLRQPNESPKIYETFQAYLNLSPQNRSLENAWKTVPKQSQNSPKTVPRFWKERCIKYHWVERVQAYDDHMTATYFLAEEEATIARARRKVLEREKIENLERELAELLLDEARAMLNYPRTQERIEEKYEDGRAKITILEPKKWSASNINKYIEVADKLLRLSANMHTDATRVDSNVVIDDAVNYILGIAKKSLPDSAYQVLLSALHPKSAP